jgi:hypothetical protein
MSGIVKSIKKVFKAVVKVVKKIAKPLLIAAAIYFTAGLALSAFPATAGFAASMPGFAAGGLLGGGAAGTGIFTKIAAKLGLSTLGHAGGLVGGALAKGTTAAALTSAGVSSGALAAGTAKAAAAGLIPGAGGAAAAGTAATVGVGAPATAADIGWTGAASGGAAGGAAGGATVAAKAGMSLTEKLLLAQAGTKVVGAFLAPTDDQVAEAQKKWRGAFYGAEADGKAAAQPQAQPPAAAVQPGRQLLPQPGQAQAPGLQSFAPPPSQPTASPQSGRTLLPENDLVNQPFRYGAMA